MKLLGSILLTAAGGVVCVRQIAEMRRELRVLGELITALEYIVREIRCNLTPLPRLIARCAEEGGDFFPGLQERLKNGGDFETAWQISCEKLPVKEECREQLRDLGGALCSDEESAIKGAESRIEGLKKLLWEQKEARREKEKLYFCVCGSAVSLLWILLI